MGIRQYLRDADKALNVMSRIADEIEDFDETGTMASELRAAMSEFEDWLIPEVDDLADERDALEAELEDLKSKHEDLEAEYDHLEIQFGDLETEYQDLEARVQQYEAEEYDRSVGGEY